MKTVKQTSTVDCSWKTLTNRQVLLKLHYLNNVIINETTILLPQASLGRLWLSYFDPLVLLFPKI